MTFCQIPAERAERQSRGVAFAAIHAVSHSIQVRRLMPHRVPALLEPVEGRKVVRKFSDAVTFRLGFSPCSPSGPTL